MKVGFFFLLLPLALHAADLERLQNKIEELALIQGKAISDRRVMVDAILEEPKLYQNQQKFNLSSAQLQRSLQRVIDQSIVTEEGRIVGTGQPTSEQVRAKIAQIKQSMGMKWKNFISEFNLSDSEIENNVSQQLAFERALAAKLRSIQNQGSEGPSAEKTTERATEKAIAEWLRLLRIRYGVQILNSQAVPSL